MTLPDPEITSSEEDRNTIYGAPSIGFSKYSSQAGDGKDLLGFDPVPNDQILDYCAFLSFWLKGMVTGILMEEFPGDIIRENGSQLVDIIEVFSGKKPGNKFVAIDEEKRDLKVKRLHKFYSEILSELTTQGAFLAEIRPEFLLCQEDLQNYLKVNKNPYCHPVTNKVNDA